jgi:hypothetical protein
MFPPQKNINKMQQPFYHYFCSLQFSLILFFFSGFARAGVPQVFIIPKKAFGGSQELPGVQVVAFQSD